MFDTVALVGRPDDARIPQLLAEVAGHLLARGRRVLAVSHLQDAGSPLPVESRKAEAVLAMLRAKGISRADVFAHSEGALVAAMAAALEPTCLRSIILLNPAGLLEEESLPRLMFRFGLEAAGRLVKGVGDQLLPVHRRTARLGHWEAIRSLASPGDRIREVWAMAHADIRALIRHQQRDEAIRYAVISTTDDVLFPLRRLFGLLSSQTGIPRSLLLTFPGVHVTNVEDHARLASLIDGLLGRLEAEEQELPRPLRWLRRQYRVLRRLLPSHGRVSWTGFPGHVAG